MHIFYSPDNITTLNEEESRHAVQVLRLKTGDEIWITDGKGGFYKAQITNPYHKACEVKVIEESKGYGKRNFNLHIAIAPTKNIDRLEWFLEKATEIGIDEITPLLSRHSERDVIKSERLQKVLVSAIKQSVKAYLPKLNELTKFNDLVKAPFNGQKFIAHCATMPSPTSPPTHLPRRGEQTPLLQKIYTAGKNALILVGPEGDFSPEEVTLATQNGFTEISLGDSRLRTETAGLQACSIINILNEI